MPMVGSGALKRKTKLYKKKMGKMLNFRIFIRKAIALLLSALSFSCLESEQYPTRFEGVYIYSDRGEVNVNVLEGFLPYNPVIIEGGAYWGDQTSRLAKLWPRGKIFAFEPNPRAFEQLKKRITADRISNAYAYDFALADYNGTATLYLCHGTTGNDPIFEYASSLLKPTKEMEIHYQGPKIEVPCINLDSWCKQNNIINIDLLILELQGMELPVLISSPEI